MSLRSPSCDGGSVLLMNLHWEQQPPLCSVSWARTCGGGVEGWGQKRVSPAVTDGLGEEMQVLVDFQAIL